MPQKKSDASFSSNVLFLGMETKVVHVYLDSHNAPSNLRTVLRPWSNIHEVHFLLAYIHLFLQYYKRHSLPRNRLDQWITQVSRRTHQHHHEHLLTPTCLPLPTSLRHSFVSNTHFHADEDERFFSSLHPPESVHKHLQRVESMHLHHSHPRWNTRLSQSTRWTPQLHIRWHRSHLFTCSTASLSLFIRSAHLSVGHCTWRWTSALCEWNDELWQGTSRRLSQINCNTKAKDECFLLRQYIQPVLVIHWAQDTSFGLRIPFRSYCDTFVDLGSAEDENLDQMSTVVGVWHRSVAVSTRQCIDREWRNDGEWDCADGSDEEQQFLIVIWLGYATSSPDPSLNQSLIEWESCDWNITSFVCLSPHESHRQVRCVNLSRLGDGKIDCLGGIDERNTLRHPADPSSPLGHNFLCSSTNTTMYLTIAIVCSGARCPNQKWWSTVVSTVERIVRVQH